MSEARQVRLFRNGRNQAVRIPVEFELPGTTATMRQDGDRLIIEPARKPSIIELLDSWDDLDVRFPDIDADLPSLDDPAP